MLLAKGGGFDVYVFLMSTLEKAIGLLQKMPENQLEAVYMYMRFVTSQTDSDEDPTAKRQKGVQELMSFAGTLPEDFDNKRELEEARAAKYARFI